MEAVEQALARRDFARLCQPERLPHGGEAVPMPEHYLPLLVMLGAAADEPI